MSLSIITYPTASGLQRAMDLNAGMSLAVKYIQVGSGKQSIQLDAAGRAITETLKVPVGYVEVLNAKKVTPYQWQLTVDLVGLSSVDWNFSEFRLCDADKNPIAIYGSATQSLYPVTQALDDALLAVNLTFNAFPANSITIEHHNIPLNLIFDNELAQVTATLSAMTDTYLKQHLLIHQIISTALSDKEALTALINTNRTDLQTQVNNEITARNASDDDLQLVDANLLATLSVVTHQHMQQIINS